MILLLNHAAKFLLYDVLSYVNKRLYGFVSTELLIYFATHVMFLSAMLIQAFCTHANCLKQDFFLFNYLWP